MPGSSGEAAAVHESCMHQLPLAHGMQAPGIEDSGYGLRENPGGSNSSLSFIDNFALER